MALEGRRITSVSEWQLEVQMVRVQQIFIVLH